jgi:hypothetical protein
LLPFLAFLEQFYSEMAAEPPFHGVPLNMLSRLQIPLRTISCFHQWVKNTFSAIGEKPAVRKSEYSATFSPLFKE